MILMMSRMNTIQPSLLPLHLLTLPSRFRCQTDASQSSNRRPRSPLLASVSQSENGALPCSVSLGQLSWDAIVRLVDFLRFVGKERALCATITGT